MHHIQEDDTYTNIRAELSWMGPRCIGPSYPPTVSDVALPRDHRSSLSYFSPAVELVALVCGLSSSCWCRSLPSGSSGRCLSHQEFNVHCGSNTAPVLIPAITQSSQLFKVWVHIVYGEYSFVIYPICRPLYSMILLRNIIYNIYIATSIASPYTSKDKGGLVNLPNN